MSTTYFALYVVDILCKVCCNITKYVATYNTKYVAGKETKYVKLMTKHVAATCFVISLTISYLHFEFLLRIASVTQKYESVPQAARPMKACCDLRYQTILR
jgi:hypothetical protein